MRRSTSPGMPLRRQPRPCPGPCARVFIGDDILDSSPVSLLFFFCFFFFFLAREAAAVSSSSTSLTHRRSSHRGDLSSLRSSSFPTCYHLVNHRAIGAVMWRPSSCVFSSCERVSFIHVLREKANCQPARAGGENRTPLIANRLYCMMKRYCRLS